MEAAQFRAFTRADRDWLVAQHQAHYAANDGFDSSFGVLVGDILDAFLTDHDATCEHGWIAHDGPLRLGSIFCVRLDDQTAKLRLFFLHPDARGFGLGKRLLAECMTFARASGYTGMQLWTHESHTAACALYKKAGWVLDSAKPVTSFGQELVEQQWSYRF